MTPFPSDGNIIGVNEDSPLLAALGVSFTCTDSWTPLNFDAPPWGKDHYFEKVGRTALVEKIFPQASEAFRKNDKGWEYNTPDCTKVMHEKSICGLKLVVRATAYNEGTTRNSFKSREFEAQVYDGCPENHWNNAPKKLADHPDNNNGIGNPCKRGIAHVDLSDNLWQAMGFPAKLSTAEVEVRTPDGRVLTSGSKSSPAASKQNSEGQNPSKAENQNSQDKYCDNSGQCFPFCTQADPGNGSQFGWQPELKGPNGGSCRFRSAGTKEGRFCDSTRCYPYCTNGSSTGGGFGWQPELNGPNGGSCKVP